MIPFEATCKNIDSILYNNQLKCHFALFSFFKYPPSLVVCIVRISYLMVEIAGKRNI